MKVDLTFVSLCLFFLTLNSCSIDRNLERVADAVDPPKAATPLHLEWPERGQPIPFTEPAKNNPVNPLTKETR